MSKPLLVTTRIRDFKASNTRPVVGETIDFTGYLEWHLFPICRWYGLDGKPVKIIVDGKEVASGTTSAGGFFRIYWTPKSPGEYIVRARYDGDPLYNACESPQIRIRGISQRELKAQAPSPTKQRCQG